MIKTVIPKRKIQGISAVLLPFLENGQPDYDSFLALLERTIRAGLTPAVNMDTGYANLISEAERGEVLGLTSRVSRGSRFVAGVFTEGEVGDPVALAARKIEGIRQHGGTPILFQSTALSALSEAQLIRTYQEIAANCDELLAFELGQMFAPFGRIYNLDVVREIMRIPQIKGLKHSSLNRQLEWDRLALRDQVRPDFKIYTGNDLAIDMVMYGSDYLLGLSTFAPDYFARRDAYWQAGDPRFYELNDVLQYLGQFAFRAPTAAYKHSAAQFLKLRGWIQSDSPHPEALRRPETDREILQKILEQLEA